MPPAPPATNKDLDRVTQARGRCGSGDKAGVNTSDGFFVPGQSRNKKRGGPCGSASMGPADAGRSDSVPPARFSAGPVGADGIVLGGHRSPPAPLSAGAARQGHKRIPKRSPPAQSPREILKKHRCGGACLILRSFGLCDPSAVSRSHSDDPGTKFPANAAAAVSVLSEIQLREVHSCSDPRLQRRQLA